MRFRLRTLLILTFIGPPLLVVAWEYLGFIQLLASEGAKLAVVIAAMLGTLWATATFYLWCRKRPPIRG